MKKHHCKIRLLTEDIILKMFSRRNFGNVAGNFSGTVNPWPIADNASKFFGFVFFLPSPAIIFFDKKPKDKKRSLCLSGRQKQTPRQTQTAKEFIVFR